jgi:UDP-N-acetylmuramyl pentapeptide synthase
MKDFFKKTIITILTWEAKLVLRKYKPKIVGITGSVGKTSTKDAIYTALRPYVHVRRSEKSHNSELGVVLSILGLPNAWSNPVLWARNILAGFMLVLFKHTYPEWLVLEIGADKPGDISGIAQWLKPDAVVLTRFPDVPVHIEFFESKEHVIAEKKSLAEALKTEGLLVLNGDDPEVLKLHRAYGQKTVTYGFGDTVELRAKDLRFSYVMEDDIKIPFGREWTLVSPETSHIVSMPYIISENHISAALAACSVVYGLGFPLEKAVAALREYHTPPGRLSVLPGTRESIIIDDTYNSSPIASRSALDLLRTLQVAGRKIAVIGDMMELGKFTQEAHVELGAHTVGACDLLVTVGIRSASIDVGAQEAGFSTNAIEHFKTAEEATEFLQPRIQPGDVVLIKGSQSVRLERMVKALLRNPETAQQVLVRQENEWQRE